MFRVTSSGVDFSSIIPSGICVWALLLYSCPAVLDYFGTPRTLLRIRTVLLMLCVVSWAVLYRRVTYFALCKAGLLVSVQCMGILVDLIIRWMRADPLIRCGLVIIRTKCWCLVRCRARTRVGGCWQLTADPSSISSTPI